MPATLTCVPREKSLSRWIGDQLKRLHGAAATAADRGAEALHMGDKLWDFVGKRPLDRVFGASVALGMAAPGGSWRALAVADGPRQTLNQ
jgi:hypothetical protein